MPSTAPAAQPADESAPVKADREGDILDDIDALSNDLYADLIARAADLMGKHGEDPGDTELLATRIGQTAYGVAANARRALSNRPQATARDKRAPGRRVSSQR